MKCSCFLQNKWLEEGEKTIKILQVSAQSQPKNVIKICVTCKESSVVSQLFLRSMLMPD